MGISTKHSGRLSPLVIALAASLLLFVFRPAAVAFAQETPPPNFKIAFIGDQGLGPNAVAVLNLIKAEGAQAVLHSGDLEYTDNPAAWEAQINGVLGANFPYFVTIGNHDELAWGAPNGYQQYVESRFNRLGISWSGRLGVRSSFHYKGILFVLTAPGITSGFDDGGSDLYIRDQLAADNSVWSVCSWHKNQRLMQVGAKADETGWGVYEEARKGGAIIATAHEHSYSRTHLLSSMSSQAVADTSNTLRLAKGNSFAFVSGLGGHSVRTQSLGGNWWASAYASTCLQGDPVCQPNAGPGALFAVFNVDGQPNKALFYFKDINGKVVDQFVVFSNVETPFVSAVTPASVEAGVNAFALTLDGAGFVSGSVVQWNGVERPTTFVSPTRLTAEITKGDVATPGSVSVTVFNPAPGGGTSNAKTFMVNPTPPRLLTEEGTGRAVALDSVTWLREPFPVLTPYDFSPDARTRVMLFAADVDAASAENVSAVTAQAEDSQHKVYPLAVEFVGKVPGFEWLTQVVVKLPDELSNAGEVLVSINVRGTSSNKVPLGIKPPAAVAP
jgi:uncharacterized protein (TIGR03437 family)